MSSILEQANSSRKLSFLAKNKKYVIVAIVILVLTYGAYLFFSSEETGENEEAQKSWTVKQDDLQIAIEADGKVVAEDGVELSFSVSDDNLEVEKVFVEEGDTIQKGDKIATVKTESLEFSVRSAYSSYLSALADYNEITEGASDEDKADAQDRITSAEISLEQAEISLANTKQNAEKNIYNAEQNLKDAKEKLDDNRTELTSEEVQGAYDSLVDTIKSINITLDSILKDSDAIIGVDDEFINDDYEDFLGVKNVRSMSSAVGSYKDSEEKRDDLNTYVLLINSGSAYSEIDEAATLANETLTSIESHLYDMQVLLNASITATDFTQAKLDGFKATINSNRATINSKITALRNAVDNVDDKKDALDDYVDDYDEAQIDLANAKDEAERDIKNAEANVASKELNLEQVKREYDELLAPLTTAETASARSRLTSASVNLEKAQFELEKATIISPIDGEVARLNYATGDIIVDNSSSDPVATIINNDTLFIEVNIEEADINKIEVGQKAYATFDALDDLKLEGEVSFISLTSKTENSGIVTYMVRILINNTDKAQIREGMTAFVDFVTAEANDVLVIPVSAVSNVEGSPSVMTEAGEWQKVTTGFTDGKYVEVISGLELGAKIIY